MGKIFREFGTIVNEHYPLNDDGETKGYIFLEFKERAEAEEAVRQKNRYRLDKKHTLLCNLFTDFDIYENIPEEFVAPKPEPYKDTTYLSDYLMNENCFDQFSVVCDRGATTTIYLNAVPETIEVVKRERWTESCIRWSPRGTYLATLHAKGIALWGGEDFRQIHKFSHPGVQSIDFSPCEKYLVTSPLTEQQSNEPQSVTIWDIRTGREQRTFDAEQWPVFKWSSDDKYFARIRDNFLSVYETPSFGLLNKKSIKRRGIQDFSWSPSDNILAYWTAEDREVPARISLTAIPSREQIRTQNLFNVAGCTMHWQNQGRYLCFKVARYNKCKRENDKVEYLGIFYNLEIFHMQEKNIPVDSLEIKENIQALEWEPQSNKFGVITGELPSVSVAFFLVKKGQGPTELKTFDKMSCNSLFWSPRGQNVVLACLRNMSGTLVFVDTREFEVMKEAEHFMATHIEWDPTGRYVVSSVSWLEHRFDNAYWMWSFQGKVMKKLTMDKFCQFLWRPRPPSILKSNNLKNIRKTMDSYTSQFEIQDKMWHNKASREIIEKRHKQMADFTEYRQRLLKKYQEDEERRRALRNTDTRTPDENNFKEETIEFLENRSITLVK